MESNNTEQFTKKLEMYTWSTLFMTYHLTFKSDKEELAVTWHKQFVGMMTLMYIKFFCFVLNSWNISHKHSTWPIWQLSRTVMCYVTNNMMCSKHKFYSWEIPTVSFVLFWHSQLMRQLILLNRRFHIFCASLSKWKVLSVCTFIAQSLNVN